MSAAEDLERTEAGDFLAHLYEHHTEGWLTLFAIDRATGDKTTRWAPVTDADRLAAHADTLTDHCVWFGAATRKERLGDGRRGSDTDTLELPGLWLDIDIAGPGHRVQHPLPTTEAEALELVGAFPIPPTVIVRTGGGIQPWWLFSEPMPALADAKALLARWGHTWTVKAAGLGWGIDNVFERARVMRLPGTMNTKDDLRRPVTVIRDGPWAVDWDRRYGADDLDQWLSDPPAPPEVTRKAAVPYIGPERPGDAFDAVHTAEEILRELGFHSPHPVRGAGRIDYVRPGKMKREGYSASYYPDDDHATIWSSTCAARWPALDTATPYSAFGLLGATVFGGDYAAAASDLRARGYGDSAGWVANPDWIKAAVAVDDPILEDLPPPRPLPGLAGDAPVFPVETLPDWIREPVEEIADGLQVPVDLPAMIALGVLASLTHGKVRVTIPGSRWSELTNLFLAVALDSGIGKSPAFKPLTAVAYDLEEEKEKAAKVAKAQAEGDLRILDLRIKAAEQKVLAGNDRYAADEHRRLLAEKASTVIPGAGRAIADDATPEALARMMGENGGRMSVLSSEGQVFDAMAGQYLKAGESPKLDVYLKGFSGERLTQDRIGRDSVVIPQAVLTICVCTQPKVLTKLADCPDLASRGATARFMYAVPECDVGNRDRSKIYEDFTSIEGWNGAARHIGERFAAVEFPLSVALTSEAAKVFTDWDQAREHECRRGAPLRQMVEWVQKLRSTVLRVAGLLAIADGNDEVALETVERAITIGGYWLEHAKVVHRMWGVEDVDLHLAKRMAAMLSEKYPEGGTVTLRDLYRVVYRDPRIDTRRPITEEVAPAVELLIEYGHLARQRDKRDSGTSFAVVPRVALVALSRGGDGGEDTKVGAPVAPVAMSRIGEFEDPSLSQKFSESLNVEERDSATGTGDEELDPVPDATEDGPQPPPPAPTLERSELFGGPCDDDDDPEEEQ